MYPERSSEINPGSIPGSNPGIDHPPRRRRRARLGCPKLDDAFLTPHCRESRKSSGSKGGIVRLELVDWVRRTCGFAAVALLVGNAALAHHGMGLYDRTKPV